MCAAEAASDRRTLLRLTAAAPLLRWTVTGEQRSQQQEMRARSDYNLAVLKREQTMRLLGAYTNYNRNSWNIDSGQPDENAWKAGRDDFCDKMGLAHSTLNAGQNFGGGGGPRAWDREMMLAQRLFPNPADYIPIMGAKLFNGQGIQKSPVTGKRYVWNDVQAYQDIANGLWDDYWRQMPAIMKKYHRLYYVVRPGYENNRTYMEDFCGWDVNQQEAFCKAIRRVLWIHITEGRKLGLFPFVGSNFSNGSGAPDASLLNNAIGSDVMNILQTDDYSNTWEFPADIPVNSKGLPLNLADYAKGWDFRTGQGNIWFFNEAKRLGIKYIGYSEIGTGSAEGEDHAPPDTVAYRWWSYHASRAQMARQMGLKIGYYAIWSPGDGGNMQDYNYKPNSMDDLKANIHTLIGDELSPATIQFGNMTPTPIPGSTWKPSVAVPTGFAEQTIQPTGVLPPSPAKRFAE